MGGWRITYVDLGDWFGEVNLHDPSLEHLVDVEVQPALKAALVRPVVLHRHRGRYAVTVRRRHCDVIKCRVKAATVSWTVIVLLYPTSVFVGSCFVSHNHSESL